MDPDFLQAQVLLAEAYGRVYWLGEDPDGRFATKASAMVADIARRWPDRPESRQAHAQYTYTVKRDYAKALTEFQALQVEKPNDAEIASYVSSSLKRLRRYKEQLVAARHALSLDPENRSAYTEVAFGLAFNGLGEEAIAICEQATQRFPEDASIAFWLARNKMVFRGDRAAVLDFGRSNLVNDEAATMIASARFAADDVDGAVAALEPLRLKSSGPQAAILLANQANFLHLADTQRLLGNVDAAWALIADFAGDSSSLPNGQLLALKPYYDAQFGKSAAYRAYMAGLENKP